MRPGCGLFLPVQQLFQSFLQPLGGGHLLVQQADDLPKPFQQCTADSCRQQSAEEKGDPASKKGAAKPPITPMIRTAQPKSFSTADVSIQEKIGSHKMQKSQRFPRAFCGIPQAVFQVYPAIWQERDPFRFQ